MKRTFITISSLWLLAAMPGAAFALLPPSAVAPPAAPVVTSTPPTLGAGIVTGPEVTVGALGSGMKPAALPMNPALADSSIQVQARAAGISLDDTLGSLAATQAALTLKKASNDLKREDLTFSQEQLNFEVNQKTARRKSDSEDASVPSNSGGSGDRLVRHEHSSPVVDENGEVHLAAIYGGDAHRFADISYNGDIISAGVGTVLPNGMSISKIEMNQVVLEKDHKIKVLGLTGGAAPANSASDAPGNNIDFSHLATPLSGK